MSIILRLSPILYNLGGCVRAVFLGLGAPSVLGREGGNSTRTLPRLWVKPQGQFGRQFGRQFRGQFFMSRFVFKKNKSKNCRRNCRRNSSKLSPTLSPKLSPKLPQNCSRNSRRHCRRNCNSIIDVFSVRSRWFTSEQYIYTVFKLCKYHIM